MKETKTREKKRGFTTIALPMLLMVFIILLGLTPRGECAEKAVSYLDLNDYSGPVASAAMPGGKGAMDYARDVNSRGGVNGVKINCISVDTRYNVARAVSTYRRYRRGHNVFAVVCQSTPFGKALWRDFMKDNIVGIYPADGEVQGKNIYGFAYGTVYQDGFAAMLDWIMADWKKKEQAGPPVFGYLAWDNAYGRESLKGGKEYAEKIGVKLLPTEFFPVGTLDHSVYLQRLAKQGANYINLTGVDPTPTNIMKDAVRLGLKKDIQFVNSSYWGPNKDVGLQLHPEIVEGVVLGSFFLRGDEVEKHPAHKLWLKYRPNEPLSKLTGNYLFGVALMKDFEAALKIALKMVSYEKLDGKILYKAYQQLNGSTHREGITGTCTYSPTNHRACQEIKFYRCQKGKLVPISDWVKAPDAVSLYKWD